jgi:hypothetical protein
MRVATILLVLTMNLTASDLVAAQVATPPAPAQPDATCPSEPGADTPTIGSSNEPLSDKLAESKGVLCPPTGVDPQMQIPPPAGGKLKVIPPPGTPGGDQSVQPK